MKLKPGAVQLLVVIFVLLFKCNFLHAAWWEIKTIPVPPDAQEVNKEKRNIFGAGFDFNYYATSLTAEGVKDFYRSRLPVLGWKESNLSQQVSGLPNLKPDPHLSNALEQNMLFEKDDELLVINFMAKHLSQGAKTEFSIAKGKLDMEKEAKQEENVTAIPQLLTKPKKDIAPVFPGAILISLAEDANAQQANYTTGAGIEKVAEFYKSNMASYGWSLQEEKPVQEVELGVADYDFSKSCPDCPKEVIEAAQATRSEVKEMKFSNAQGYVCDIVVSSIILAQPDSGINNTATNILVNYEKRQE